MAGLKWCCGAIFVALIAIICTVIFKEELLVPKKHPSEYPEPVRNYWGKNPSDEQTDDISVHRVTLFDDGKNNENEAIFNEYTNLWLRHQELNPFKHENIIIDDINNIDYNTLSIIQGEGYGIDYNDFFKLVSYLNNDFEWNKYKNIIQNSFDHYMTKIKGLNIHFIKHTVHKNANKNKQNKVEAVIFLHGWPSSFWEYHKMIKIFNHKYKINEIDIIIPSLPGYGFSEYPTYHTEFDLSAIGQLFIELMEQRLNYSSYIAVGGDWGSGVIQNMAYSVIKEICKNDKYEKRMKGMLIINPAASAPPHELLLILMGSQMINKWIANKYNVSLDKINSISMKRTWDLVGYAHEHATRANTVGISLESSPIAHLAWIYEKYLSASDSFKDIKYDKNKRIISGKLNWDDVIITNNMFWYNGKISSGIRWYTECLWKAISVMSSFYIPQDIAVGLSVFEGDPDTASGIFEKWTFKNIVFKGAHKIGGHFPALEYPEVLYDDVVEFIRQI